MKKTALIIGATGATGKELVSQLLGDDNYSEIKIFVRKDVGFSHPKLSVIITDFDDLDKIANQITGDVLFSTIGTTKKQAGSKENQFKIDHDYPLNFARIARQNGINTIALVSSDGANADSPLFYYQMKGKLDNQIQNLGFERTLIFRPPLLKRPNSDRLGENLSEKLLNFANGFGLLKSAKPLAVHDLAKAMIVAVERGESGIIDKEKIRNMIA